MWFLLREVIFSQQRNSLGTVIRKATGVYDLRVVMKGDGKPVLLPRNFEPSSLWKQGNITDLCAIILSTKC